MESKRPPDEVLFKWDPKGNFTSLGPTPGANFTKRRMTNLHNSYKIINQLKLNELELDKILKESTTEGLNVRPETLEKLRDKRAELLKNLKKFQLHSCKDWLGENTPKSSIHKVDTLDRLSSMIINPEFPIKHEAVLYSVQLGKSDLEFYNALYLTKLTRMSNPTVLELIRQPVFIRDRMLLLTDRKTCNCPLNAITKQTTQRHLLPRRSFHDTQSQGDGILNKLMSPGANPMSPGLFSSDRSWSQTLLGTVTTNSTCLGAEKKHELPKDDISDGDIVCPFHVPQDLPEQLKSPKGHSGYIKDYNLLYRSDSTANEHFLILHQLTHSTVNNTGDTVNDTPGTPMGKYRLPSKLLSINSVYLRDFEFERHYSCKPGDLRANPVTTGDTVSLSSVYTGLALFIATKTEFLICITDHTRLTFCTPNTQSSCTPDNTSLKFCILLREKNLGHSVVEILSHKSTGRIFLLATNSLLYEYQYQLGFKSTSLLDHKIFRLIHGAFVYGKNLVTACIRRNTVYSLPSTNLTNTNSVTRNNSVYNCLEGLEKPVVGSVLYYPPLLWGQSHTNNTSDNDNIFPNGSQCACGLGCRRYKVNTYLRCINPWNKTYMKMSDSIGIIDQDRSIISLLNSSTGDLSVFYIHSNISLQEYTNSIHRGHRIFPYDLTLYNLRHSNIINSLDKLGYGRHSYGTKFVKMLAPPVNFVQGVDLIIVDNLGTRIFIGFSNLSLVNTTGIASVTATLNPSDTIHITPNSNTNTQSTLSTSAQSTSAQSKLVLSVKGFRVSMRNVCQGVGFARGPFSLFRAKPNVSSFMVDDLFITMEPVRKNNNGTLIRVILTSNDSTSFFQNYPTLPLSVTEEFYYFNEDLRYKNLQENQPVEYYHEFYLKLTDKEKILSVHMETSVFPGKPDSISVNQELINKELNCKSNELGDSVTGSKMVIVTTEKVYKFNRLDLNLIIKLLIKYTKNAVDLIKPPPILCTPTHNRNSTNSTVNYSQDEGDVQDERFILNKYIKGDKEENYFINSLKVGKLSECPVNSVNTNPGTADMSEYMKYLQGNKKNELTDIFGEDLVEVCENSKELVGYSLYYLSWLYGPETLFKHLFTYLTELKQDFDHISDNTVVNSVNTSNVVNTVNTMNETVDRDIIYKYLLCSLDDYNVFMGSFGIPSRIFNYVVPGCYSVLDHKFEKPVISPWCNFVSFSNNNKVKHARVTANTSPLVDGLLLLVSELLTPIYLNRVLNLVPNLHTLTVINGVEGNFNPISVNRVRYTLNNLVLDKFEDENEFVVGSRVDTYLTTELSMGLEMAMKQLEQLNSLHSIALELIKNYQKCNLENVILLMTTLGPNVQRMILKPNLHQYEPYPVNSGPLPDSFSTTPFTDLYHTNGTGDTTANTGDTTVNTVDALKSLIIERYEADLRTLKELVLVLEVAQEFLASCVLLHRSTALGDYKYEFDKNLHLVTLLPSKTANSFFTPSDYVPKSDKFVTPFKCKFTRESPKSKLTITHSILNIIAQANLINLFLNKDVYKLFRIVVWLIGGDTSALEKFFYGHIFTFEEITSMNRCNRVKYLERHFENTQDASNS
eukprot:XP_762787.1 hypothetical protein [Theileria parva strain Muguga]